MLCHVKFGFVKFCFGLLSQGYSLSFVRFGFVKLCFVQFRYVRARRGYSLGCVFVLLGLVSLCCVLLRPGKEFYSVSVKNQFTVDSSIKFKSLAIGALFESKIDRGTTFMRLDDDFSAVNLNTGKTLTFAAAAPVYEIQSVSLSR